MIKLIKFEVLIRTSLIGSPGFNWIRQKIGSPGFSRIRRSRQCPAALADIHRLKPGLLDGISGLCSQLWQGGRFSFFSRKKNTRSTMLPQAILPFTG